ncbi:tRNA (N(6)-L-threonylcarbamoyladenosine(37)-C(2))-methylthiotransferase MtaB [Methylosinus sp. R-45379]|uniref:MiaB/RimO family radical SAM methylthiotransferase n=1 Tax=Methylosinus sp. R-45379 TaxID=980563 RepID=UPI0007C96A18|nr:MiaB/RimO family radical SAM methylthiotransferase [Methylosinus sp. R-45379]OAI30644.1 tRNA (N(6)-L-threonylcarbamoyladenosine(37)-C(2))-methylthiotransferase MtaB [Methylosinus sp. R-45379]
MTAAVDIVTFGCRLNYVDSERLLREARAGAQNERVIVNTCAVTAEATRQARQTIRRLKRERPTAEIVVAGCAARIDPQSFAAMDGVTRVLTEPGEPRAESAAEGQTRAFLAVQNGCDHSCTFCIIPLGRGPSRSIAPGEVVAEARRLVESGKREIVLTGVDLTSYSAEGVTLGGLARALLRELPQLERLRLSSIDCIEADAALFDCMAAEPRLMPHLHLSLQSGDDLILKRMKRRHSRADAIRFCSELRAARPDIVFGADFITGFPTETEDMFARTLALVEECGLTHLHVFPYSPRPGTPAALMPQVNGALVKERAARLRAAGEAALGRHLDAQIGKTLRVLTEKGGMARAEDFTALRTPGAEAGRMLEMRVTGHDGKALSGRMI